MTIGGCCGRLMPVKNGEHHHESTTNDQLTSGRACQTRAVSIQQTLAHTEGVKPGTAAADDATTNLPPLSGGGWHEDCNETQSFRTSGNGRR